MIHRTHKSTPANGPSSHCRAFLCLVVVFLSVAVLPATAADSTDTPNYRSTEAQMRLDGDTVFYTGETSHSNVSRFLKGVRGRRVKTLVISSTGGETESAMRLGWWVYRNGVNVVVSNACLSSAANYVFTAGKRKTIQPGAVVAWHGNAWLTTYPSEAEIRKQVAKRFKTLPEMQKKYTDPEREVRWEVDLLQKAIARSQRLETEYFKRIGVSEQICRIGIEKYGAKDFYFLSAADMKRFGVDNVTVPQDYEETDLTRFREHGITIEYVTLEPADREVNSKKDN